MTSRLDRLLLLLDTGSSQSVRHTAAKQLAQLAVKSVTSNVQIVEEDTKREQTNLRDQASWAELMSVVARIIPFLHSKSFDTRTAASVALSQIFSLSPVWQPLHGDYSKTPPDVSCETAPDYPKFSLRELLTQGKLLLASSGKEFMKPAGILSSAAEVKKARKEAMTRLGLDFLDEVADDMDLDKELTEDMVVDDQAANAQPPSGDVASSLSEMEINAPDQPPSKESSVPPREDTPAATSPTSSAAATPAPELDLSGLSARERNRLKRKRKPGNSAFVAAPPPQSAGAKFAAAPVTGPANKARLIAAEDKATKSRINSPAPVVDTANTERVVIDPSKGGAVSPKAAKQSRALEVEEGCWIWDGVVNILEVDLLSAAWEVRHGAALALRELLKAQGRYGGMHDTSNHEENELAHEKWCNDLSAKFLCVFVLDRFGDFVSDQVVAPVRETVSQTLASLLIHMPRRSMLHVHSILLQMIRQDSVLTLQNGNSADPEQSHVWEVRHAGLLGIKYEVAVRSDLFDWTPKQEGGTESPHVLKDVVDAAILGLGDRDDDVRSVAASCLLPVANHLVEQVPEMLEQVLIVLWHCLSDMKDDLSSSVGAVMDLLGTLVTFQKVIDILANDVALPLATLATTLFPFFRHTISNVRLAVVKTLDSFMTVPTLPREWISTPFLCLLLQNLICEERVDIRDISLAAWERALSILSADPQKLESTVDQGLILNWYAIMMTPIGLPIDTTNFYRPYVAVENSKAPERHNVDKNMLAQDLSLISMETIFQARITAAKAMAELMLSWRMELITDTFRPIIIHYMESTSMAQRFLAGVISEEWAFRYSQAHTPPPLLLERSSLARELSEKSLGWLQGNPPLGYHELTPSLGRIHTEVTGILQSFSTLCKLPASTIPVLPADIDVTGTNPAGFNINTAQKALTAHYTRLRDSLGRTKKKELATIAERKEKLDASIKRYAEMKAQNDNRVSAAFAGAFVAFESVPDKVSPVVKGIMNGIKNEENLDLQTRSAVGVSRFINFCTKNNITQPPDKIVKNLCTFLCQDAEETPMFSFTKKRLEGILSFTAGTNPAAGKEVDPTAQDPAKLEELRKAQLSRRGARLAFQEFSNIFGSTLFDVLPNIWPCTVGGLLSAFQCESPEKADQLIEKQFGQDVIDSLSVLEAIVPTFHPDLHPKFTQIFPMLDFALRSQFAIIRQCAAKCFATVCDVMPDQALKYIVEHIIPMVSDPMSLANRQGAIELIYQVVQRLDIKVLPYVIFLVVPILGRMSDVNDEVRATATNTFASLVKMVPLEAGLPDPPGFSEDLLKRREEERQFLSQLLDGTKVEQYQIPVTIDAELRKYQQDGVNWLAFLAKYQLHGILCDDMGLGKTLQSICILASKHFERTEKRGEAPSPDNVHLPSLIVCPPTLTGHWYYEIQKYAGNLKPVMYTGNSRERSRLVSKLHNYDIVITSYEVVRNDISTLEAFKWLYCILDEGHVIKNSKTKLTKAVKQLQAQHRLILSGTPIQNNVLELWSLFDFLMPGFLGTEMSFNERFSKPILSNRDGKAKTGEAAALALEALHKQVLPFLLRRLKEDVLHDLPPKIIQDYYCELSDLQKQLYDDFSKSRVASEAEESFQSGAVEKADPKNQHVFQSLQYLRKLCNHPALVLKDPELIASTLASAKLPPNSLKDIQNAPKLLALKQLLLDCGIGSPPGIATDSHKSELIDTPSDSSGAFSQHRVLIFCQMKQMLDIIETDLFKAHMPSVTYMRLDGSTDSNKRHAIVQTFNADPSIDCLLLTTHVGGLGLTLTGADTVIFVEHDWNPMKDLQAMDRAHRIGQKKVVNVYRLVTKGTLEEKIMGLQRFKLNIAHSVVTQQNAGLSSMETDQVLDLFKRTTEEEDAAAAAKKAKAAASKQATQKNILAALEDLPEDEYEGLDLSSFMTSLGRP